MGLFGKKEQKEDQTAIVDQTADETGSEQIVRLLNTFVELGSIQPEEIASIITETKNDIGKIGDIIVTRKRIDRGQYIQALSQIYELPAGTPPEIEDFPALGELAPEQAVRNHGFVPVGTNAEGTVIAFTYKPSLKDRTAAESASGKRYEWYVSDPITVASIREQIWRSEDELDRLAESFIVKKGESILTEASIAASLTDDDSPVILILRRILEQALRDRASDVHLEPLEKEIRIRFRVDGELVEVSRLSIDMMKPLMSIIKIQADMNIVQSRAPQDGQFSTIIDGRPIDVRVSSVAVIFGEKIVMRILDKGKSMVGLSGLGMPSYIAEEYSRIVKAPYGMIICAGPTGAGKTTTLYASLQELNDDSKNVTTIEDPVEYVFEGINQVQTNELAGLTFATGLRALLRQDPNVILVGEIRDVDTARIAIQASLTGHTVLSSLHGNDSVAAVHRLLDMGIESFLVASAVTAVVAQRLVRRICEDCKTPYEPEPDELATYRAYHPDEEEPVFYRGAGCPQCLNTGFRDRIGVYELLPITTELRRLIIGWATTEELRRLAVKQGMRTLQEEGMRLVKEGITTIPEVVKTLFTD